MIQKWKRPPGGWPLGQQGQENKSPTKSSASTDSFKPLSELAALILAQMIIEKIRGAR